MIFYIVGYMASGKTTFGSELARQLKIPFIDLDRYVEEKEERSINELFSEEGEDGFRKIESRRLREATSETPHCVIACGGGTPCHFDNMDYLNENGITVFLETSTPVLISRLQAENETRPIVANKSDDEIEEQILSQLCERLPRYMEAKLKWHGDDLENQEQIETNVEEFINSYPSLFRDL
ncbi:MAG: shikimate kinase [Muribaculaceae bacterium]|nr:shikimate kinase [Muribaculaceae bacterium]